MRQSREVMADLASSGLTPDQLALVMELSAALGADIGFVSRVVDVMREHGCTAEQIGVVVGAWAVDSIRQEAKPVYVRRPDRHTKKKDSNKSRRGLSNQRWAQLRYHVFDRDGWQCVYCGALTDLTCDHVIPLNRGGTNDFDNLATACRSCNSSKSDKLLSEWRARA